jgi:hypothetical protein
LLVDPNLSDVPVDEPDHDDRQPPVDEMAGLTEGLRAQARRVERLLGSGVQALGDVEGRCCRRGDG